MVVTFGEKVGKTDGERCFWSGWGGVLNGVVREGSPEMTLSNKLKEKEVSHVGSEGKVFSAEGTESAKALRQLSH